jgi:hypothetical protein
MAVAYKIGFDLQGGRIHRLGCLQNDQLAVVMCLQVLKWRDRHIDWFASSVVDRFSAGILLKVWIQ